MKVLTTAPCRRRSPGSPSCLLHASAHYGALPQALAWVAFLPSERRVTSVVEVSIQTRAGQPTLNACYEGWSAALGVRYFRVAGRLTGGCTGGATSRDDEAQRSHKLLACNVTCNPAQLVGTILSVAQLVGG
jgi:hypothetical protein